MQVWNQNSEWAELGVRKSVHGLLVFGIAQLMDPHEPPRTAHPIKNFPRRWLVWLAILIEVIYYH